MSETPRAVAALPYRLLGWIAIKWLVLMLLLEAADTFVLYQNY
jgi:hypothetical protein